MKKKNDNKQCGMKAISGPKYRVTVDTSEAGTARFAIFPEKGDELCEGKFSEFTKKHGFRSLVVTGAKALGAVLNNETDGAETVTAYAWSVPAFVPVDLTKITDEDLESAFSARPPVRSEVRPGDSTSFIGMLKLLVTREEYLGYLKCSFLEKKLTGHDDESVKFLRWLGEERNNER